MTFPSNGSGSALIQMLRNVATEINRLGARMNAMELGYRTAGLPYSSLDGGANLVALDDNGMQLLALGQQADGTTIALPVNQPPLNAPSAPGVTPLIRGLEITWDGNLTNEDDPTVLPLSWDHVEVHLSPVSGYSPDFSTLYGTMKKPGAYVIQGLDPTVVYYSVLVAVEMGGTQSTASDEIAGQPLAITADLVAFSARDLGGPVVTVGPTPPPATSSLSGDQWLNTSSGYQVNIYDGTNWNPIQWDAGAVISASTIAANLMVAGIVVAGIVDATVIRTATLVSSTILGYATPVPRGPYIEGFQSGTVGWTSANGTIIQSTAWSSDGDGFSLMLAANGLGQPLAYSADKPCTSNDPLTVFADLFTPTALSNLYLGIVWLDSTHTPITETDGPDSVNVAGGTLTLTISDLSPANAAYYRVKYGCHAILASGTQLFIDNVNASGNLAYAASPFGGTDALNNRYAQGIVVNGVFGLQEAVTIQDAFGRQTLAAIDAGGNVTGNTFAANTDLYVGGLSLLNDILPVLPQGVVARTNVFANALPAPATPTTSEFYLYELDVQMSIGREYLLMVEPIGIALGNAGKCRVTVYCTTDGSQPTNASPIIIAADMTAGGITANLIFRTPPIVHQFGASGGLLWRFLVSLNTVNTGSGVPTVQVVQVDNNPGDDSNVNARFTIYDMGATVPNTGLSILTTASGSSGSSGGTRNYTTTWTATGSHCYQGSDGGNPNLKINDNGQAIQGGDRFDTYNGKAKTWYTFNLGSITGALAGATITKVQVYLNNNHTWYNAGATACIGWDNKTSFGSTAGDPGGSGVDAAESHFNEGQGKWVTVPNSFGTNFRDGNATTIVLWRNSNNLGYYAIFAGANQSGPCQLKISYTK